MKVWIIGKGVNIRGSGMKKIIYKEKIIYKVGERTEPWGTPLETGKDAEVAPSTTTDIKRLDKKLEMSLQKEGVKPKLEVWLTEPYARLCQMP